MSAIDRALFAQLLEHPDDDAPRLVYADVLSGAGDPRGELIALQCRLAATPDDGARRRIRIAENKLLAAHGPAWEREVREAVGDEIFELTWRRGFIHHLTTRFEALDHVAAVVEAAPLLRSWTATSLQPLRDVESLAVLFAVPAFAQLDTLHVGLPVGNSLAFAVAESPHLHGLRSLTVEGSELPFDLADPDSVPLDAEGVRALSQAPTLSNLRSLGLAQDEVDAVAVEALADARFALERFTLRSLAFDDEAALVLATRPEFGSLRHLELRFSSMTARGAAALAGSSSLERLESLDLEACRFGTRGGPAFFRALRLPALHTLRLKGAEMGDEGVRALLAHPVARSLRTLDLGINRLSAGGLLDLARAPSLSGLERLLLNDDSIDEDTVAAFAASKPLAGCKVYLGGRLVARGKRKKRGE